MRAALLIALAVSFGSTPVKKAPDQTKAGTPTKVDPSPKVEAPELYTTYFYTAAEAVVHGYSPDTHVRIISLGQSEGMGRSKGTIFEGTIGRGETKLIPTGKGVFGFLSDKKASILVGTPSSCAVVGYFLKDENGSFLSDRFFAQLPSATYQGDERVVVWAYKPAHVTIRARKSEKVLAEKELEAGGHLELGPAVVAGLNSQVLDIESTGNPVSAEVYYDEGFIVPSSTGRGAGRLFFTYVGKITNGQNDLNVISQITNAHVTVTDLGSGEKLFDGVVNKGDVKTLTLSQKYVKVESDATVDVVQAALKHYVGPYQEHHFATGLEGSGIENDFLMTTSEELWLFSYFADTSVKVEDQQGKKVFEGKLDAGNVRGLKPGFGVYRVTSSHGISVMGGSSACGADYSPAAGMFAVDEAMLKVVAEVREARIEQAKTTGTQLTDQQLNAPLSDSEWKAHGEAARKAGYSSMTVDEANTRAAAAQAH